MAYSLSPVLAYDDEANLTLAEISSSEGRVTTYSSLIMSNPTSSIDPLAGDWGFDTTINPALLTQGYVSSGILAYDAPMQQP